MDIRIHGIQKHKNMQNVEDIVKETYPLIYAYVIRRVYDSALAKDITQETFYSFFTHLNTYENKGKTVNYLYRIAANKLQDHYRKQKHYVDDYDMELRMDPNPQPQEQVNEDDQKRRMRKYLNALDAKDQDVLILRYYQDLKFKDIADILGMNVSTVKSRVKGALRHLEVLWKEGEHSER